MKVELKIEGPGIQVYCYELNAERKKEFQENFDKMVILPEAWKMDNPGKEWIPPRYPMDMVEEEVEENCDLYKVKGGEYKDWYVLMCYDDGDSLCDIEVDKNRDNLV